MNDSRIIGVFNNGDAARAAMLRLSGADCEIFSSEPLHSPEVKNHLLMAAIFGGLIGGVSGGALAVFVFTTMGLKTGHMAMITLSPTGIIVFGLTALGAIAGVLLELLREAGLFGGALELPHAVRKEVTYGAVVVLVRSATPETRQILESQGARFVL
jgi:hypothetical protein